MKDEHALPPPLTTDALTDEERAERARLIEAGKAAQRRGHLADVEFGRHLRELRDRRLYRDDGHTWASFLAATFDISDEHARRLIQLAELHNALGTAGAEPLVVESHARVVSTLPLNEQVEVVQRARELAQAEGTRLFARHLQDARNEFLLSEEALDEGEQKLADEEPNVTNDVREAVRAHGGLHIVLPDGAVAGELFLPGRVIVSYEELVDSEDEETPSAPWTVPNSGQGLTRADLDEVAEFTWPVLVPDAWEAPTVWEVHDGDFRATYFPDRLGAPTTPVTVDKKLEASKSRVARERSATVLIAPGVDLLHPDLPDFVLRAVVEAAGLDFTRRYLFLTEHPKRAAGHDWPTSAFVAVAAQDAASVTRAAEAVTAVLKHGDARFALVLHDADEALPAEALEVFDWVLLRGSKTTQACYDSVFTVVPQDIVHVGRGVRARHRGYPTLHESDAEPQDGELFRRERRAVPIISTGDGAVGPHRPPVHTS